MEDLLKRLQNEAGLNEDQSIKAMEIIKDFMDKEGIEIDWEKFFKEKYVDLKGHAKSLFEVFSHKTREYSNVIEDKVEDFSIQAKRTARDLAQKASDLLDDTKKK